MIPSPIDLIIDSGNSRYKLALFQGSSVLSATVLDRLDAAAMEKFVAGAVVRAVALGSVAAVDPEMERALAKRFHTIVLTGQSPSPLRMSYDTPQTLGVDRLANAVAAAAMFPGRSALAIDIGTCITYDLVTVEKGFEGGIISPGPYMRAQAMHAYSARLPMVDPAADVPLIGRSTVGSLGAGVFHGVRYEIEGVINDLRQQAGDLAVALTGGGALPTVRALKTGIFADPLLTLRGLHALLVHQLPETHTAGPDPGAGRSSGPGPGK